MRRLIQTAGDNQLHGFFHRKIQRDNFAFRHEQEIAGRRIGRRGHIDVYERLGRDRLDLPLHNAGHKRKTVMSVFGKLNQDDPVVFFPLAER